MHYMFAEITKKDSSKFLHTVRALENRADFNPLDHEIATKYGHKQLILPIIKRNLEIGILRALGMRIKEVRNMFLLESMILMISAGFMGVLIGSYSAYLMESNLSLMTELPTIFSIPIDTIIRVFSISVIIGIIGMYLILLRLSRQTLMDIFRQTF